MKCSKLILTISVLLNCSNAKGVTLNSNEVSGYYWRDYTDEIPSDAVPGGTDNKGEVTYIGQTLHPGSTILPGFINAAKKRIFYESNLLEHSATEDVKILCSQHAENLQWVSTKSEESISNIGKNTHLVVGGHDQSRLLAIGRKSIATGESILGKVLVIDNKFAVLYYPNAGKGLSDHGPYEVLAYNTTLTLQHQKECVKRTINIYID